MQSGARLLREDRRRRESPDPHRRDGKDGDDADEGCSFAETSGAEMMRLTTTTTVLDDEFSPPERSRLS
jgi:hypothetical protein